MIYVRREQAAGAAAAAGSVLPLSGEAGSCLCWESGGIAGRRPYLELESIWSVHGPGGSAPVAAQKHAFIVFWRRSLHFKEGIAMGSRRTSGGAYFGGKET